MRIGIYGGSFDPIHSGHAMLANFVAQCGIVDELWITVNRRNPLKSDKAAASDSHRLVMAGIVASKCLNVKVCDIEMSMPSPSYTYDTLLKLKEIYPQHEFRLVMGSDSFLNFSNWKKWKEILKSFGLIVYPRPGYPLPLEESIGTKFLSGAPEFSISSSLVREYIRDNWDINYFVPLEVAEYISQHHLYK